MNHVDPSLRPGCLGRDSRSLQFSLQDVRESAACEDRLFHLVAGGQCANKIAFGDSERVSGKPLQRLKCEMLAFIRNSILPQCL